MKNNKGITLVALIITIIIMLILVAVSINVVIKSNILNSAKNAGKKTADEIEREANLGEVTIDGKTYASISDYIEGFGPGKRASQNEEYTVGGKTAIIPGGFTLSGNSGEKTIEGGLVIYLIDDKTDAEIAAINWEDETTLNTLKTTYDQFVWIPIKNTTDAAVADINDMFMCQNEDGTKSCNITVVNGVATCTKHTSTNMAGRLYATGGVADFISGFASQTYTDNGGLREPGYLTDFYEGDAGSYNDINLRETSLQTEYNSIVEKVYKAQGFWVGRYETSGFSDSKVNDLTTTLSIVKGKTTSNGISNVNWYRMYKQQQNYANQKGLPSNIQSSMISGAAYDQIMLFANCSSNTTPTKTSSEVITGNVSTDCYKNIYDLCGNLSECTTEAYSVDFRVIHRW